MSARRSVTVSITLEQDALLSGLLARGRSRSVGDVFRSALVVLERDKAVALSAAERSAVSHEAIRA